MINLMAPNQTLAQLFATQHDDAQTRYYDLTIVLVSLALMAIGFVIVTSASMPVAARLFDNPFHFAIRHVIYLGLTLASPGVVLP